MKKHLKTTAIVLLNVLFCAIFLYYFSTNCWLRPSSGSLYKEIFSGVLLLASLYINYYLFYPKIHPKKSGIYWLAVVVTTMTIAVVDFAMAYSFIISRNAQLVELLGPFNFFSRILFFAFGRNLALNFFLYLFRERQHLRQSLEKETKIVYERVRMLDVADKDSNIHLVAIDDIFYCLQQGNFTTIYTVHNEKYTRLGSMKHLEQLFGEEEFIRISATVLVPFQYIQSCEDNMVVMKQMPWQQTALITFPMEARTQTEVTERIAKALSQREVVLDENKIQEAPTSSTARRKPALPSEEKVREVLSFIEAHPNCNSMDIVAGTDFSLSTVERCLAELKKQGTIQYTGSKKRGGYSKV